jgi:hypothetical protein
MPLVDPRRESGGACISGDEFDPIRARLAGMPHAKIF